MGESYPIIPPEVGEMWVIGLLVKNLGGDCSNIMTGTNQIREIRL